MKNLEIRAAVCSHKGRVRANNEDNFYFDGSSLRSGKQDQGAYLCRTFSTARRLFAICDGMGGIDAGETASLRAVQSLREFPKGAFRTAPEIAVALQSISDQISADAEANARRSGTTIAMLSVDGDRACIANVGDSRVYRLRSGALRQMSLDHSEVQRLISAGSLTAEEARSYPGRHIITQFLGMPGEIRLAPFIETGIPLAPGDVFLLCSDGLTDMVDDREIHEILCNAPDEKSACRALVEKALSNGGRDNVTVMVLAARQISALTARMRTMTPSERIWIAAQAVVGGMLTLSILDFLYYLFSA